MEHFPKTPTLEKIEQLYSFDNFDSGRNNYTWGKIIKVKFDNVKDFKSFKLVENEFDHTQIFIVTLNRRLYLGFNDPMYKRQKALLYKLRYFV